MTTNEGRISADVVHSIESGRFYDDDVDVGQQKNHTVQCKCSNSSLAGCLHCTLGCAYWICRTGGDWLIRRRFSLCCRRFKVVKGFAIDQKEDTLRVLMRLAQRELHLLLNSGQSTLKYINHLISHELAYMEHYSFFFLQLQQNITISTLLNIVIFFIFLSNQKIKS